MFKTVFSSWVARGITAVSQLYVARLVAQSVGLDGYATFALLLALGGWIMLLDFGLGAALQNYIAESRALAVSDREYRSIVLIAHIITLLIVLMMIFALSGWLGPAYLKASHFPEYEATSLFALSSMLWMLNAIAGTGLKILYAESRGYLANLITSIGYVTGVVALLSVNASFETVTVGLLLTVWVLSIALPGTVSLLYLTLPCLTFKINRELTAQVMKRAGGVFIFAFLGAGTLQIDYLVMSQFLSDKDIAIYNIITKIFALVLFVYSAMLTALWPVITALVAETNWAGVAHQVNKHLKIGFFISFLLCLFVIINIDMITGFIVPSEQISPGVFFLILMAIYIGVRVWTDTYAQVLLSASHTRPLIVWAAVQGIITLLAQLCLVGSFGIYGIVSAMIISYGLTVAWALPMEVRKLKFSSARAV